MQARVQASSPSTAKGDRLPFVVLRGATPAPWYRRRIPPPLVPVLGAATITVKIAGHPQGTLPERRRFLASYSRIHQQAEQRLSGAAASRRKLTAAEQLGVAGSWASVAPPRPADPVDAEEVAAILGTAEALGVVLPCPVPPGWKPSPAAPEQQVAAEVVRLAYRIDALEHPCLVTPAPSAWVHGQRRPTPEQALAWLADAVGQAAGCLTQFQLQARAELERLGVVVDAAQQQAVAHRLAVAGAALSQQQAQLEAGRIPAPINWPPPPAPNQPSATIETALQRWQSLRSPTAKTIHDARARLQELADHAGGRDLAAITAEQIASWRDGLLKGNSAATVKRRLALVRAVLKAAASDGLPVDAAVLERLGTPIASSSGTARERRPFDWQEARTLWGVARQQQGARSLDRWALPLGLSLGCRLEELAGLRPADVRQIDGQWVVVVEPHALRRLKNNNSARTVPIPRALVGEGFIGWVQQQSGPLLFPEPKPPAADPRLSHYASIRLGKIIRAAGISDRSAVFHSCRHFVAQALVDAGTEQRVIEQLLGHSTRSMTARYSRGGIPLPQLAAAMEGRDWGWVPPG